MPQQHIVLNVFLASPSDVAYERDVIQNIINELNKTWSKNLNLRLELLRWETDVIPNFGEYSQDVINQQIGNNYDIFIGLLWSRFGMPTALLHKDLKGKAPLIEPNLRRNLGKWST
ncbi:hypothetical protein GPS57_15750 [Acinetobacter haemolyticus]|uniref:hypothetical protein n=1 Tax=Acinetobacter haemolyticus TaxID=29430 RepID=UPI00144FA330|nr:hypothetical protein [Acinetobacter haemolyticus]NAR65199.1 hypothetical protein [Acinetobacter haemolyticus]